MGGDHRLVGSHHRQAAGQRRARRCVSRPVGAADRFDEDVDLAGRGQRRRVVEERRLLEARAAFGPAERANRDDDDVATGARREVVSPSLQQARPSRCRRCLRPRARLAEVSPFDRCPVEESRMRPTRGPICPSRDRRSTKDSAIAFEGALRLLLALLAGGVARVAIELALVLEPLLLRATRVFRRLDAPAPPGATPRAEPLPRGEPCARFGRLGFCAARSAPPRARRAPQEWRDAWPRVPSRRDRWGRIWGGRETSPPSLCGLRRRRPDGPEIGYC